MSLRQNRQERQYRGYRFSYQSECHCAKTGTALIKAEPRFSYQSECHCAKTLSVVFVVGMRLVTSQNVTAPKQQSLFVAAFLV